MIRRQRGRAWLEPGSVVPSAPTTGQQRFEAALLQAAGRAMSGMRRRGNALRPTSMISRAQPDSRVLGLQVHDAALDHLLAEVLPVVVGGRLRGVPGLRAYPRRDHLDLRSPDGEARLLGVTRERWRQAVATGLPADVDAAVHPSETAPSAALPVAVMSGVLRRLPLWRGAAWLECLVVGEVLELHWRGGPSSESMAAILVRSACGIAGVTAVPHTSRDAVRGVALSAGPRASAEEPEWAWVEWLAATAPGPALDERAVRPARPQADLPDVWEQQDVRAALALRDITTVYRRLLRHGVPRTRIATLTGQSTEVVDRVVAGAKVESYDALVAIAKGLGVPLGYMGLAHDEQAAPAASCDCTGLDERARRDRFLAHAALVTVGSSAAKWGCHATTCAVTRPVLPSQLRAADRSPHV